MKMLVSSLTCAVVIRLTCPVDACPPEYVTESLNERMVVVARMQRAPRSETSLRIMFLDFESIATQEFLAQ